MTIEIDFETRSACDVRKTGAYRYFEDESTSVLVACYAIDDGEVQTWWPKDPPPEDLMMQIRNGDTVRGWNVGFERQCFIRIMGPRHGWAIPNDDQYDDNAACGAAMGLPRALEDAAEALNLGEQKDTEGAALMKRMAKINGPTDFDSYARLAKYCAQDVRVSRAVRKKLFPLSAFERKLWLLDLKINDRGVRIDQKLVEMMEGVVSRETNWLDLEMHRVTRGAIKNCTQSVALARWITANSNIVCASVAKGEFEHLLKELPYGPVRDAVLIRQEAAKTSTGKLKAAKIATSLDGRARGMLLFNGAFTRRWAGRLLQPHNMMRPSGMVNVIMATVAILRGYADYCYPNLLSVTADCMRGIMAAGPGRMLLSADYSSIEARVTAWIAGDKGKLDAFRAADRGEGPDMYIRAAAGIYNVPVDSIGEDDKRRQVGKTAELALGFGGGVAALAAMALNYGIDLAEAFDPLWENTNPAQRDELTEKYFETLLKGNDTGLEERAWKAAELIKRKWRKDNPLIVASWKTVHDAAWKAMNTDQPVGSGLARIGYHKKGGFLKFFLPSGGVLYYGQPALRTVEVPWSDKTKPRTERETMVAVTVRGIDSVTRKFSRYPLYKGIGIQHAVQATARDLLAHGMINAENNGFPIVLTVHDELVAEAGPDADLDHFRKAVTLVPPWADGIPLVADGWKGRRYRK